jgi:hypothetical protein
MKKPLFFVFYVIFCLGLLEFGSAVLYFVHYGSWYSYKDQQEKMSLVAGADHVESVTADDNIKGRGSHRLFLHPYIGFSGQPNARVKPWEHRNNRNEFGFWGPSPLTKTKPDQLLVAVSGGSVAAQIFTSAGDVLKKELERAYPGKEVILCSIALGGMKQPQQLMALNYFLVLGAKFDVIINLDGYNEAVLALWENHRMGIAPFFPRSWQLFAQQSLDIDRAVLIGQLATLKQEQVSLAAMAQRPMLNSSIFVGLLWQLLDNQKQWDIFQYEKALSEYKGSPEDAVQVAGPTMDYGDASDVENMVVDIWENSSRQMSNLARGNNIEYFHFLQPNQYYEGSKPLTKEEIALLLPNDAGLTQLVRHMYPKLVERAETIQKQGDIRLFDLTQIYRNNNETLYIDNCCHLNQRGYELMAGAIADRISSNKLSHSKQLRP